ncbi:MAG: hypothetical protein H6581_31010 [Bacteroidia bacterium]|nr:hypothetical protein [Bacteroidia bacterium]
MKLSEHPYYPLLDEIADLLDIKPTEELDMATATRVLDIAESKGWEHDLYGFCRLLRLVSHQPGFIHWREKYALSA